MKRQILRTIASWGVLTLFMMLFQPDKLPVVVLIVPFVLLFMAFYSSWQLLYGFRGRYRAKKGLPPKPRKHLGLAVCLSATLLLVLQSLGQLTLKDVLTVVAIVVLGYVYLARSRFEVQKH